MSDEKREILKPNGSGTTSALVSNAGMPSLRMRLFSDQFAARKNPAHHQLIPKVCRNNVLTESYPPLVQ